MQNSTRPMLMGYAQRARHYTWPALACKCEKCTLSVLFRRLFEYSAEGKEAVAYLVTVRYMALQKRTHWRRATFDIVRQGRRIR